MHFFLDLVRFKETGHFSRNSLSETIKLKNTRLVVSSFTVFRFCHSDF